MKRLAKTVVFAVVALFVLTVAGISMTIGWRPFLGPRVRPLTNRMFEATPSRMERGRYLVESVTGCLECHSERDRNSPELAPMAGREGAGALFLSDPGLGTVYAPNITPDKETGIGNWSDDQIARAIREGIGSGDRALFPIMPYPNFRNLSDEDLASVVVFIKSIPPIRNSLPVTSINFPVNRLIMGLPEPITEPVKDPDLSTPIARGEHLVTLASCSDCHTPQDANGQYIESLRFAGGNPYDGARRKKVAAANLTSDPSGIPYYDEATFIKTIRAGQIGARSLDPVMPWGVYKRMTDEDMKAVFAYVHTLPPVTHYVDNSAEATMCPKCGHSHGLGDKNKK